MKDLTLPPPDLLAQWHWHLPMLIVVICALWFYGRWVFARVQGAEKKRGLWFFIGLSLCLLLISSPLEYLGQRFLFSMHMLQRLLLIYGVAWFFILSIPPSLWIKCQEYSLAFAQCSQLLARPLPMAITFNLGFTMLHIPLLFETALHSPLFHLFEFLTVLFLAVLTWFPLLHPQIEARATYGNQLFYIMTMVLGQVPLFAILTLSGEALFPTYTQVYRIYNITAYADQQMGGWLLKLFTTFTFGIMALLVILRWAQTQKDMDTEANRVAFENFNLVQRAKQREG